MTQPIFISLTLYAKRPRRPTARGPGKGGVDFILAEAGRSPWAAQHVAEIAPPTLVFNLTPPEIQLLHDDRLNRSFTMTVARVRRCIRPDQCTLLVAVASYKGDPATVLPDQVLRADYEKWEVLTLQFLQRKFGDDLAGVVRHTDESNLHVHAYIVPGEHDFEMRARSLHPGHAAEDRVAALALADGQTKKIAATAGRIAYKKAMSAFLDDFYLQVGLLCGHMRRGSMKGRRLRADIMAERRAAEGIELANRHRREIVAAAYENGLDRARADADAQSLAVIVAAKRQGEAILAEATRQADEMKTQAARERARLLNAAQVAAADLARTAKTQRREASRELAAARQERANAARAGSQIGAFVAGVTGATGKIREEVVAATERDRARATASIAVLQDDNEDLQRQIRTLERKLTESRDGAHRTQVELERLQARQDRDDRDDPDVWTPPDI